MRRSCVRRRQRAREQRAPLQRELAPVERVPSAEKRKYSQYKCSLGQLLYLFVCFVCVCLSTCVFMWNVCNMNTTSDCIPRQTNVSMTSFGVAPPLSTYFAALTTGTSHTVTHLTEGTSSASSSDDEVREAFEDSAPSHPPDHTPCSQRPIRVPPSGCRKRVPKYFAQMASPGSIERPRLDFNKMQSKRFLMVSTLYTIYTVLLSVCQYVHMYTRTVCTCHVCMLYVCLSFCLSLQVHKPVVLRHNCHSHTFPVMVSIYTPSPPNSHPSYPTIPFSAPPWSSLWTSQVTHSNQCPPRHDQPTPIYHLDQPPTADRHMTVT